MECNIVIGAEAGQGGSSVETELTETLSRLHYDFFAGKNYMSRVRGGHNFHMIRVADRPVHAWRGKPWDMVVALDEETAKRHRPDLHEKGIYLDPAAMAEVAGAARTEFRDVLAGNTILVGIILAVVGVKVGQLQERVDPVRLPYLARGFSFAAKWGLTDAFPVYPRAGDHCIFDGNKAVALGALFAGCQFLAGYPMTPASSIMRYYVSAAASLPAHFEQAEDEIAAINMALGASYAGLRSMVATAGGGFALMQEGVSLAGMTETPIVIVVGQRPGPATGLPTRTEQGDLNFILHSGHGEFPRVAFAPGSIGEAISLVRKAFDLADRYQIPVFILTDQYFADSVQIAAVDLPAVIPERDYGATDATYRRYALTESGISPLACPGLSASLIRVDSDEHDEEGRITEDLDLRTRMVEKRMRKMALLQEDAVPPTFHGAPDAVSFVLSWGSNRLLVEEAVDRLTGDGIRVAALHFGQVYPLTAAMVAAYGLAAKTLICVENNAHGQFSGLLKRELGLVAAHAVLKYN